MVGTLLAALLEARYHDSAEVLRDLGAVLGEPLPVETVQTRESFLWANRFVGRQAEREKLNEALAAAAVGNGSIWLLSGESGVGKSRVLSELRTHALVKGFWTAEGQSVSEGGSLYQEWVKVLRVLCVRVRPMAAQVALLLAPGSMRRGAKLPYMPDAWRRPSRVHRMCCRGSKRTAMSIRAPWSKGPW